MDLGAALRRAVREHFSSQRKPKKKENPIMTEVRRRLPHLTDAERKEIFREYCPACGAHDPSCVCTWDE